MNFNKIFMAFVFVAMLSGGVTDATETHFGADHVVSIEETVFDSEMNDDIAYKLLPSSSSASRRANRRATSLHRQRLDKKRSRWSTLSFKDKWERVTQAVRDKITLSHIKHLRSLAVKAKRQNRILQGGLTRIAVIGAIGGATLLLGSFTDLTVQMLLSTIGFGLVVGAVRDGSEYVEIRKGLVADKEQVTDIAAEQAKVDKVRNFKAAKFAKNVENVMTQLNAAKAQTMAAKIALQDAENRLQHSDESRRPSGKTMLALHERIETAQKNEQKLVGEINMLLDTSTAVEAMSKVKADSYQKVTDLFVTNPTKQTCSFEIECKFPNDGAMSYSATMESIVLHIKSGFRAEGISQNAYSGDYSATDQSAIVVSVDSSLDSVVDSDPSHDEMHMEENGYVFCVEIKTPVWTIERATKRIPILMDALKSFRIPGGTAGPEEGGRGFIDIQCGQHIHFGITKYGHQGDMRRFISRIENKFYNGEDLNADETFWVNWMNAIVCNYAGMQEQIDMLMHYSRRSGNCYYSNPVGNYARRIEQSYALSKLAGAMQIDFAINEDGEIDSQVWKDMWLDFINCYCAHGRDHYLPSYTQTWEEWDPEDQDVPDVLYRALNEAKHGAARHLIDMIASERGAGDGGSYPNVNMGAITKHGTVEFRQQGGLLNSDAMLAWLYFLHSLVALSMGGMRFNLKPGQDRDEQIATLVEMSHHSVVRSRASTAKADDLFQHLGLVEDGVIPPGWSDFIRNSNPLMSDHNKHRDFKAVALGAGVVSLIATLSPLMLLVSAVVLLINCGIGGLVKMYRNKNLTRREAFGLRKILTSELGSRGKQSIGVAMFDEGRGRVRKAARPRDESDSGWTKTRSSWGTGYATGWSRYESGSDMPTVAGPLLVEALAGSRDHRDYTADAWMVHTRYATNGAINERNAHPMRADNITLMHNGVVEDRHLRKFGEDEGWWDGDTRLAKDFVGNETDTFAIAAALNYAEKSDNDGVHLMSQMVDGSMRIAWVDEREKLADNISPRIHLWSNTQDLWFGETVNGNVVWASEKGILLDAFGDYYTEEDGRGKSHHGSCLKSNSVFPAQIGAHYVIDYDFGLINLGQCGVIAKHDADAWKKGKSNKTKKTASQNTKGEVMVTETKGGVTTIKPLSQVEACSSPAKDCGPCEDVEQKWIDEDSTDAGVYVWDMDTQTLQKEPVCPCGLQESACVTNCPALLETADADAQAFMDLGLAEAAVDFGDEDWDCVDCLAGDCVCDNSIVQQVVAAEVADDEADMEQNFLEWVTDNVNEVDYSALSPDERAIYNAFMENETHSG